jgi:starvation-inducible outer membrane lipoprotein
MRPGVTSEQLSHKPNATKRPQIETVSGLIATNLTCKIHLSQYVYQLVVRAQGIHVW